MAEGPVLRQVNLVVSDLHRAVAFCRMLGWQVEHPGNPHLEVDTGAGVMLEFDEPASVELWNAGSTGVMPGATVVTLSVGTRDEVDAIVRRAVEAGYGCSQQPFDAFWGSRFAIIRDADGNQFGLMSPRDEGKRKSPAQPPAAGGPAPA
jgi:predicted lactoylglutathione lyase